MAKKKLFINFEEITIEDTKAKKIAAKLGVDQEIIERAYGIARCAIDNYNGTARKGGCLNFSWKKLEDLLEAALLMGYHIEEVVEKMEWMGDSDFLSTKEFLRELD